MNSITKILSLRISKVAFLGTSSQVPECICLFFLFSLLVFFSFLPQTQCSTHLHPLGNPYRQLSWCCPRDLFLLFLSFCADQPLTLPHSSFSDSPWRTSNGWPLACYWKNNQSHCLSPSRMVAFLCLQLGPGPKLGAALSDRTFCNDRNVLFLFCSIW